MWQTARVTKSLTAVGSLECVRMARQYAAILGLLAFVVIQARCVWQSYDLAANLLTALAAMAIFAVVGAMVGGTANWSLGETLRRELTAEMNEQREHNARRKQTTPPA